MQKCRAVPAALHIVFARPYHLNFRRGCDSFGYVDSLHHKVRLRIGTAAKASAKEGRVKLHFLIRESGGFRSIGTIDGLKLRARPDFAGILPQVHNAI